MGDNAGVRGWRVTLLLLCDWVNKTNLDLFSRFVVILDNTAIINMRKVLDFALFLFWLAGGRVVRGSFDYLS